MIIYCDGGSRGNPGHAASAIVVTDFGGNVIHSEGKYLGIETNNIAEYEAVLLAVNWLTKQEITKEKLQITINLDSQLVERQLNGFYRVRDVNLQKIYNKVKNVIQENKLNIKFQWGYREKNKLADSLVNETLDNASAR